MVSNVRGYAGIGRSRVTDTRENQAHRITAVRIRNSPPSNPISVWVLDQETTIPPLIASPMATAMRVVSFSSPLSVPSRTENKGIVVAMTVTLTGLEYLRPRFKANVPTPIPRAPTNNASRSGQRCQLYLLADITANNPRKIAPPPSRTAASDNGSQFFSSTSEIGKLVAQSNMLNTAIRLPCDRSE